MNHYNYTLKQLDNHADIATVIIECNADELTSRAVDYLIQHPNSYLDDGKGEGFSNDNGTLYKFTTCKDKGQTVIIDQMLEPTADGITIHPSNIRRQLCD